MYRINDEEKQTCHVRQQSAESLKVEDNSQYVDDSALATTDIVLSKDISINGTSGAQRYFLAFGLCLSAVMVSLDTSVVATLIPKLVTDFNSLADIGWYGSVFLLAAASMQIVFGQACSIFGPKPVYLGCIAVFSTGSLISGFAINSVMFIAGRAVSGVGDAGIYTATFTILAQEIPLSSRPIYISLVTSVFALSSTAGPPIGGFLADKATWRWCFYMNPLLGFICFLMTILCVRSRFERSISIFQRLINLDWMGIILFTSSTSTCLLYLGWAGTKYSWTDWRLLLLLAVFVLSTSTFIVTQIKRPARAVLPPRVFKNHRNVAIVGVFLFFESAAWFVFTYYLSLWMQSVQGLTSQRCGILLLPFLCSSIVASFIISILCTRVSDIRWFMCIGSLLFIIPVFMFTRLTEESTSLTWILIEIFAGLSSGICIQVPFVAIQACVPAQDAAIGCAIAIFGELMGGAVSLSLAQMLLNRSLQRALEAKIGSSALSLLATGLTDLRARLTAEELVIVLPAIHGSIIEVFYVALACSIIAFLISLLLRKQNLRGQ